METKVMEDWWMTDSTNQYIEMVKALDPELYEIKIALIETQVNHEILLHLIRSLALIRSGTGYGEISVQIRKGSVGLIKATENVALDLPIV